MKCVPHPFLHSPESQFYDLLVKFGPDGVWAEHERRILSQASISWTREDDDDDEDGEGEEGGEFGFPPLANDVGTTQRGEQGDDDAAAASLPTPGDPNEDAGHRQRLPLFLRPLRSGRPTGSASSPGLHRAFIPKLYAIKYWRPRLSGKLLPKYLLSLDETCAAHLFR